MSYFVFEDLANATSVKIHRDSCGHTKRQPAETTKWHEFDTLDEAVSKARELSDHYGKGYKLAECCFK